MSRLTTDVAAGNLCADLVTNGLIFVLLIPRRSNIVVGAGAGVTASYCTQTPNISFRLRFQPPNFMGLCSNYTRLFHLVQLSDPRPGPWLPSCSATGTLVCTWVRLKNCRRSGARASNKTRLHLTGVVHHRIPGKTTPPPALH